MDNAKIVVEMTTDEFDRYRDLRKLSENTDLESLRELPDFVLPLLARVWDKSKEPNAPGYNIFESEADQRDKYKRGY